ncbi:hypothetical protein J0X14_14470 [Muricauda sp. CAU 1633]|uniref:hypothetical protein n=1 Tax=Allomuricauda sp. CAU 1633 TaxID=2816036 RepID=UPI001A900893|nr:hypothetical protein [Muricauda sp. CAU 1633]MBO0323510.1 hypothetical protein [Muricauda sp. CAU 1633]
MKTLTLILFPFLVSAQIHLNIGIVDIQDRLDGNTMAWDVGYSQFFERVGIGANFRSTQIKGDGYFTLEGNVRYRMVEERIYRSEISAGAGWNLDEHDIHPIVGLRNAVRIDEGTWLTVDFDNSYRNSQDWNGGGWRFETYLLIGISLDVKWQRNLRKRKRFF